MKNPLLAPLTLVGSYVKFLGVVLRKPARSSVFWWRCVHETWELAVRSVWFVALVSLFIGMVISVELAINIKHPLMPAFVVGFATRDMVLLEMSSTIIALVLAGKVGSSIASEIGTMRITEQIDALEVMGVNSAAYLVLPKILAGIIFFPLLTSLSFMIAIAGGGIAVVNLGYVSAVDFIDGLQYYFHPRYISYALIKMSVYGFLITSIPSFCGYYVHGGALEVGRRSTRGVVDSSIAILVSDLVLTKMVLG